MKKSIIIADDNAGLVASLKDFFDGKDGYEVVATAENGAEALAAVLRLAEAVALHHRAESAVEQQDALVEAVV